MSEETASFIEVGAREVFVRLLGEGTETWRPTRAVPRVGPGFLLLATEDYDSGDEAWEFPPGSAVECRQQILSGRNALVAWRGLTGSAAVSVEEADRLDEEEAERRLSDPSEVPIPFEQAIREFGLEA